MCFYMLSILDRLYECAVAAVYRVILKHPPGVASVAAHQSATGNVAVAAQEINSGLTFCRNLHGV